ncbi:DNA distortion polypeptide 3 [Salmonella enterica]|nr:DNA distortion polypeptide 3 [Salmonella enterica]EBA6489690.1 DNA distortion polypeptide 3 [Salmonella enterica]EBD2348569.1 DNA distortion polypeptide 3 [Salmonella enterica]EBE8491416.1 DNA distortion polypeptide 3 [Salmonella enterica]ECE5263150.1 DNA distortion polypeptide 3 [Salmonella enterica]
MEFKLKEFISDRYSKAINILNDNLKEHYHVFYGLRLSEILFPASEYGSDMFFQEFEAINSVILPLVIFDLIDRKPIMVIGFGEIPGADSLVDSGIEVVSLNGLSDLLLVEKLMPLFD